MWDNFFSRILETAIGQIIAMLVVSAIMGVLMGLWGRFKARWSWPMAVFIGIVSLTCFMLLFEQVLPHISIESKQPKSAVEKAPVSRNYDELSVKYIKLINELKSKDNDLSKIKSQLDSLKSENIKLLEANKDLSKKLAECDKSNTELAYKLLQTVRERQLQPYEHKMESLLVAQQSNGSAFSGDIVVSIEEVKDNRIYGFIGSKGFSSLRLDGVELGNTLQYYTTFYYEIKPNEIRPNGVKFIIIQYKKLNE